MILECKVPTASEKLVKIDEQSLSPVFCFSYLWSRNLQMDKLGSR